MLSIHFNQLNINELISNNEFDKKVLEFITSWFSNQKTMNVQTSGSTGTPKILEIEKSKMLNSAKMTCDFLGLKENNTALLYLPIEYISGKMMVIRSIERKLNLYISNPSLKPLEQLQKSVDFCAMTPLQVEHSLDKIHLIKNLIIGGASVSESLKLKIKNCLSENEIETKVFETYGMSETLSHIALKSIYPKEENYFTTLNGVEISKDERGCLCIYASKLNSELLKTNDLVEIKNQNQFKYLGRIDNVINSGGAKIFPEKLESFVKQFIPNEVVFIGQEDELLGQKLVLIIENSDSSKDEKELRELVFNLKFEKKLHKPKEIIFIEKIPRTVNGKINRLALKELLKNR